MDGVMSTIKMIIAGLFTAAGLAIAVVLGIVAFRIAGEVHDWRVQQATADSVRAQNEITAFMGRLALLDQNAARTRTVFVQAREQQQRSPIVTGGGKHADSVANAALNACFEKATNALTACEVARTTADSLPALKDSLTAARLKLAGLREPRRWTAKGFVGEAITSEWKKPFVAVSTDFKIPLLPLNGSADADYLIMGAPRTAIDSALAKQKWRVRVGASIPFR
jgi:hypothetical protein